MKSKTSAILITGAMLSAAVLPVQADPMLDLLKVLRDKGTISAEDYNTIADAAQAQEEKMDKMVATASAKSADSWADRIQWYGDFRYRYEEMDNDARNDDRRRNRVRARIGLMAQVTDDIKASVALASGSDDPVSSNQTLGDAGSSKGINLDQAWIDWNFAENMNLVAGKTKNPFYQPAKDGLIWDGDYRPEGGHLSYDNGTIWAIGAYHFLNSEHKPDKLPATTNDKEDTEMFGAQLGFRGKLADNLNIIVGASYYHIPTEGLAPIRGAGENFGNSLDFSGNHLYDYDIAQVFVELETKLAGLPASVWVNHVTNTDSDADEDTGYTAGFKLGKAKNRGDWEIGYMYEDLEADAVYGTLSDSDFGGGGTDVKGHKFKAGLGLAKNTKLGLTYFKNEYGGFSGEELDYDRIQLDLKTKFK